MHAYRFNLNVRDREIIYRGAFSLRYSIRIFCLKYIIYIFLMITQEKRSDRINVRRDISGKHRGTKQIVKISTVYIQKIDTLRVNSQREHYIRFT